jgi:hypothetical protein
MLNNEKQILSFLKAQDLTKFGFPLLYSSSINFEGSELVTNQIGPSLGTLLMGANKQIG